MEQNITSPELDIDKMTATLKMSRAKFFYKVKKLTGETPGSFFRIFKLNRAARLLKEGKYNISEITDRTGFSSISHFSTSFKKRYGISPKDYK
jgi:AraC-like DNA-binding protein